MADYRHVQTAQLYTIADLKPPAGYQPGYMIRYPVLAVSIVSATIFLITIPLLVWLTWRVQAVVSYPFALPLTIEDGLETLVGSVMTAGIHELIHISVLRAYGYRTSWGVAWRQFAVYAAAFGQWQSRRHALVVTLAPFIIITVLSLPLLASTNRLLVVLGFCALLTNTSGAAGDLFVAWRLLWLPRNTLVYDVDPTQMLIFAPGPLIQTSREA